MTSGLIFARSQTHFLSISASLQDVGAVVVIYSPSASKDSSQVGLMSYGGGGTENAQETAKFLSHYLHGNPRPSGKKGPGNFLGSAEAAIAGNLFRWLAAQKN